MIIQELHLMKSLNAYKISHWFEFKHIVHFLSLYNIYVNYVGE